MPPTTWEEILKRDDLVGGELEYNHKNGVVLCGRISQISILDGMIQFIFAWSASMQSNGWVKWNITNFKVSKEVKPKDIGEGRIEFEPFPNHNYIIFPKNGRKLDPQKVKDLPPNWERLLAMYPNLTFDRALAERVLIEKSWQNYLRILAELGPDTKLRDMLSKFRFESSAEEFLWHYIEAVTGEKNIHHKVY